MLLTRQIYLVVFLLFLLSCSCQTEKKSSLSEAKNTEPFPLVLDTIGIEKVVFSYEKDEPTWLTTAGYGIYFIGLKKDTIYLNSFIKDNPPPPVPPGSNENYEVDYEDQANLFSEYFIDWTDYRYYKDWDGTEIEIRIDTLNIISDSYPLLLTNIDVDTTFIGYGRHIPMVMEALDSTGNWNPIQEMFIYMCGVGVSSIILPPNESVLSFAPIFKGDFKTKLRLALGKNHSEVFNGFINYRQFESRFNEYGEYKYEYMMEQRERIAAP